MSNTVYIYQAQRDSVGDNQLLVDCCVGASKQLKIYKRVIGNPS